MQITHIFNACPNLIDFMRFLVAHSVKEVTARAMQLLHAMTPIPDTITLPLSFEDDSPGDRVLFCQR